MNYYEISENGQLVCHGTADECAQAMGITRNAFYTLVYQNTDAKTPRYKVVKSNCTRGKNKCTNIYTVTLRKTREIVARGNAEACAAQLNFSVHSFFSMVARVRSGKNKRYEVQITKDEE